MIQLSGISGGSGVRPLLSGYLHICNKQGGKEQGMQVSHEKDSKSHLRCKFNLKGLKL